MTAVEDGEAAVLRVRQVIDEVAAGHYTPPIAASEIVAKLRQHEPEVLTAWLDAQAERLVWQVILDRDRSRRSRATHRGRSSAFREAEQAAMEAGDVTPLRAFLDAPYTVADGSRRPLTDLRHDDLVYVADRYGDRVRSNAMHEAFMRALAKKVTGRRAVGDVFSDDQLSSMWSSLAA